MTKERVITEIKRLAAANGGKAPGRQRFENATGIRIADWYPHLWLRWGDALAEAGLGANKLATKTEAAVILDKYAELIRELGRVPLHAELRVKAKSDRTFPSHSVFGRFGGKSALIAAVKQHCENRAQYADILPLLPAATPAAAESALAAKPRKLVVGYVYLMKSGRHYKIGRSNSVGRRESELGIKIPVPPTTIHSIETDDPIGVEAYWHRRFAEKRGEGEWFNLTSEDIAAFKRWRKIA
jgi:hypothetical protein